MERIYTTSKSLFWEHLHNILGYESLRGQAYTKQAAVQSSPNTCESGLPTVHQLLHLSDRNILIPFYHSSLSWRHFQAVPVSTCKTQVKNCVPLMADPLEVFITSVMVLPLCSVIHFKHLSSHIGDPHLSVSNIFQSTFQTFGKQRRNSKIYFILSSV